MKNIKKYGLLLVMSMSIFSIDRLNASCLKSLKKPMASTAAAAVATYCANNQADRVMPFVQNFAQKMSYPKIDTDFCTSVHRKLKEEIFNLPDYVGQQDVFKDESIEGLSFEQLTTDAQRVDYVKNYLKQYRLDKDIDIAFIAYQIQDFTAAQYIEFFEKMNEFALKDKSEVVKMIHVDRAFAYILSQSTSRGVIRSLTQVDDIKFLDNIGYVVEKLQNVAYWFYPGMKKTQAYHEGGHALMFILRPSNCIVSQLTLIPQGVLFGANILLVVTKEQPTSLQDESIMVDNKIAQTKNIIMGFFAGGIGEQLLHGEKLTLDEFLSSPKYASIGRPQVVGSDVWQVVQQLRYYLQNKDLKLVSMYQKELEPLEVLTFEQSVAANVALMTECYEEAYAILRDNKATLDEIVDKTLGKGMTQGDELYKIAGVVRPKYEFEMTSTDKITRDIVNWIVFTNKRMAFYERNHPQV